MKVTRDFVRDNGEQVSVEVRIISFGSPATYSPMYGADGGDSPEAEIEAVYVNGSKVLNSELSADEEDKTINWVFENTEPSDMYYDCD